MSREKTTNGKAWARLGCLWSLAAMLVVVIAYFLLLPTSVFDAAPRDYPDLENLPPPPGKTISLTEALEASSKWKEWLAWQQSDQKEILDALLQARKQGSDPEEGAVEAVHPQLLRAVEILREVVARPETIFTPPTSLLDTDAVDIQGKESLQARALVGQVKLLHSLGRRGHLAVQNAQELPELGIKFIAKLGPLNVNLIRRLVWLTCERECLGMVLAEIHHAVSEADARSLDRWAGIIRDYRAPVAPTLERVFAGEFVAFKPSFASLKKEVLAGEATLLGATEAEQRDTRWIGYRLQPNRTVEELARRQRIRIRMASVPAHERVLPVGRFSRKFLIYSPAPNAGGEWLVGLDEFPVKRFYETEDKGLSAHRLTLTLIALARYRLANEGNLPTDLAALTPVYLPEIPADPYTNEPIGYDPVKGRLFSVGLDFVDSGTTLDPDEERKSAAATGAPGISGLFPQPESVEDPMIDLHAFLGSGKDGGPSAE